jgi:undecaprenyl phosphate N,N'-diacetylbacillosamine 1-phosphate transferase
MYKRFFKRLFDFIIALSILVIAFPVLLLLYLILFYQNKSKVFFYQQRPGLDQKPFRIIKFKTMTDAKDKDGNFLPDNQRITKAGSLIRKLSLDELPQLINVLKGDMSLVGPRPLLFKYIPLYSQEQLRRHNVRPGITGWAQVNGRNAIAWTKKFEYDVYYVDHMSLLFDIKIIWITFVKVITRHGVNQSIDRPMNPFTGNN